MAGSSRVSIRWLWILAFFEGADCVLIDRFESVVEVSASTMSIDDSVCAAAFVFSALA